MLVIWDVKTGIPRKTIFDLKNNKIVYFYFLKLNLKLSYTFKENLSEKNIYAYKIQLFFIYFIFFFQFIQKFK